MGLLAAAAVAASLVTVVFTGGAVQRGPAPITFSLTDENGKWFDSGRNLFGGQSLAVAVLPRVPAGADAD
ncbi:hypothetical protein, partial [Pseudonocardia pini]|uniref:hypothetical protein n=1 Tax=Pseudonocardia pini TaxID=2758030 RepID=UPI0015F08D67